MPLTIYKSSAGSGKTYTLVKEYLKIVLKNPFEYKHILAITFTNKATEEMKLRILEELENVSNAKSDMFDDLVNELNLAERVVMQNAKKTLELILHDYSRFEVSTIDSFFAQVIRSFAKELQLPLRYDMEMDTEVAIKEASAYIFANLHNNEELASWLLKYAFSRIEDDKGWRVEEQLHNLGKTIFNEDVYDWLQETHISLSSLDSTIEVAKEFVKLFEETLSKASDDFEALTKQNHLGTKDFKRGTATWITKSITSKKYDAITVSFLKAIESSEWLGSKSKTSGDNDILNHQFNEIIQTAYNFYETHKLDYYSYKMFQSQIYAYGVLHNMSEGVKQYRDDKNLLLISDVNAIITSAIGNDDAPFLYEKLGTYFKHIFIDEFQDTSNFQWNNLKPLVYNSLGEGENVMIVGDVKQSIYRFRGGNLNLLLKEVKNEFKRGFGKQVKDTTLVSNWRSRKEIVNFNNLFFRSLNKSLVADLTEKLDTEMLELAYQNLEQKVQKEGEGFVEVKFFANDKKSEVEKTLTWKDKAKEEVVNTLKGLQANGRKWSEVMLLVFKNKEANELSDLLMNNGIPFVSSHSLLANSSPLVKFLIQAMRHLQRPDDAIAYTAMLHLYFIAKKKRIVKHHWLFTDFDRKKRIAEDIFPSSFFERKNELQRLSIYELFEELCIIFSLKISDNVYLQYFGDVCLKQNAKGVVTIIDFLNYWDEKKDTLYINTPENLEAVSIMTIHKAKGLEKPVVIIPFMILKEMANQLFWTNKLPEQFAHFGYLPLAYNKTLAQSHFAEAYYDEKLSKTLDTLNKVYVALTRPKEELYIYSTPPSKTNKEFDTVNKWLYHTLKTTPELSDNFNADEGIYRFGKQVQHPNKPDDNNFENGLTVNARPYSSFIKLRSEAQRNFKLFDTEIEENIAQGLKAHAVLERLHEKEDLPRVLSMLLSEGLLNPNDINYLTKAIEQLFENKLFSSWFTDKTWRVLAEREIIEGDKRLHKPDRVLLKGDKAIIIDYKKLVEDEKYIFQVKRYGRVLKTMGFTEVTMYLVYVDTGVINEVI